MHNKPVHQQSARRLRVLARNNRHPRAHQSRLGRGRKRAEGRTPATFCCIKLRHQAVCASVLSDRQEGGQAVCGSVLGKQIMKCTLCGNYENFQFQRELKSKIKNEILSIFESNNIF